MSPGALLFLALLTSLVGGSSVYLILNYVLPPPPAANVAAAPPGAALQEPATVPDVRNMSTTRAREELDAKGLLLRIEEEIDSGEAKTAGGGWPDWPTWFETPADFPNITQGLRDKGFADADVAKVMGGNWLAFFRDGFEGR